MKRIYLMMMVLSVGILLAVGCKANESVQDRASANSVNVEQKQDSKPVENTEEVEGVKEESVKEVDKPTVFADKVSFIEENGVVFLDLENSAPEIKEKYDVLVAKFTELGTFENAAIGAATTANLFYELGIDFIAAPQTSTLHEALIAKQKTIEAFSKENGDILNIGSSMNPNTEVLIELNPDIFLFPDTLLGLKEKYQYIEEGGIEIFSVYQSDYTDLFVLLQAILDTTDTSDEKIYQKFAEAKEVVDRANSLMEAKEKGKTVAILWIKGNPRILEDGEPVSQITKDLGLENILADAEASELSPEILIDRDPDYIIYYAHGDGDVEALNAFTAQLEDTNGTYRALKAVKNGNYIALGNEKYSSFSSVDLRVIEVIKQISENVYGEE